MLVGLLPRAMPAFPFGTGTCSRLGTFFCFSFSLRCGFFWKNASSSSSKCVYLEFHSKLYRGWPGGVLAGFLALFLVLEMVVLVWVVFLLTLSGLLKVLVALV